MKQNKKRIVIFSLCCAVFLFLTGGILWFITGSTEKERVFSNEDSVFTDGEFLLNRNFPWGFYPHKPLENGNSLEIGSFYWKMPGKRTSDRWEAMTKRCAITLSLYTPQGENLFEDVNRRIHAFRDADRESKVFLLVDGNSSVTCLLRLDLGEEEHWLYLQQGDLVYQLYARMNAQIWQDFLWCLYEKGEPWIDGQKAWEGESLLNAKDGEEGQYFCYRDFCYPFSWEFSDDGGSAGIELTDYAYRENGFSLTVRHFNTAEKDTDFLEEFTLQALKEEPDFDTEEEALAYYLERHLEMTAYEAYVRLKRRGEKEFLPEPEKAFRSLEGRDSQSLYFAWNDGFYQACGSGKGNLALISYTRRQLSDSSALARRYSWEKHEGGSSRKNFHTGLYDFEQNMGAGNIFVFHMEPDLLSEAAEASGLTEFVVEVSKKGEKEPFQVFETLCEWYDPFCFRDFNADGYPDLNVCVWDGSKGAQSSRYLWSPSAGQFVQGPEELEYCSKYKVDPDTRRLSMYYLYDYITESCDLYQWSGEMEYEKIRSLNYRESWSEKDDLEGIRVLLVEYIQGRKHTLMDYVYEEKKLFEEIDSLIWDSFYSDFVWEKQIEDPDAGEIYTIRYTQTPKRDEEEKKIPGLFDAALYVYGKDTDLIRRISYETAAPYTEFVWEEEKGSLKVFYEDGSETVYTLEQIRGGM